ncbi:quinon protein alcohol dehydrogenase-like superfamily, partial [Mycena belliarum]
ISTSTMDPSFRTMCLPGTRSKVIKEIADWGLLSSNNILWMYAHAGSGKSTISTTMADIFDKMGCLGSFIFFNRDVEQCSGPSGMIRTIAYQLALHRGDIAAEISACLEHHPLTPNLDPNIQFQRLLLEPLEKVQPIEPVVIIIDALDEGGASPSQDAFLALLSNRLPQLPKYVQVMITSRRYPKIEHMFLNMPRLHILDLNQVADIEEDIRRYILSRMKDIQSEYAHLPSSWPGLVAVDALVQQANGLFVWATVACSYIGSYKPEVRLETLLSSPSIRARAETSLDALYEIAIREADMGAGAWYEEDFSEDMHNVLAIIVVSQNPQSLDSISKILGLDNTSTAVLFSRLQSIMKIDGDGCVHVIHPSVRDYLVDPSRCDPQHPWYICEDKEHSLMANRCIQYLTKTLEKKKKSLATYYKNKTRVPDTLAYTSLSWMYHILSVIGQSDELVAQVQLFLSEYFLQWLEVLSILGQSRRATDWLNALREWHCNFGSLVIISIATLRGQSPTFDPSFSTMLYDGWRFCKAFSKTIECDPALIYSTALQFCPKNTTISAMFNQDPPVKVVAGCLHYWSPSLMALTGVSMAVETMTVSKDGVFIAAGCLDGTLNIWNATDGTKIFAIEEDPPPNALRTYGLVHAQFTSDGTQILLALMEGEFGDIQIWDLETQVELTPLLDWHADAVHNIAFSHDQQKFLTGSGDKSIRLWTREGHHEKAFFGHDNTVTSVGFFPDDRRMASASVDATMKIWDLETGSVLLTCQHNDEEGIYSLAFSHKGDRIATGTWDWNVRIWDSKTGTEVVEPLALHHGPIGALAFSPDDKTLVSGSMDTFVRVWSMSDIQHRESIHTQRVNCVSLSHDKTRFVSGSADSSVIVWNTLDGSTYFKVPPMWEHEGEVVSVQFSPDDKIITSASCEGRVCFWDAATGEPRGSPLIISDPEVIYAVQLSADGSRAAVITRPHVLTVWNTRESCIVLGPL